MRIAVDPDVPANDAEWAERERIWQRKLGRLRLGVEPIAVQLARYRQVTWVLTAVPIGIGLIFVAIFIAFQRPDLGLTLAAILVLPVVSLAWLDYRRMERLAAEYERERAAYEARKNGRP
jgi:hypothetical protein